MKANKQIEVNFKNNVSSEANGSVFLHELR